MRKPAKSERVWLVIMSVVLVGNIVLVAVAGKASVFSYCAGVFLALVLGTYIRQEVDYRLYKHLR